MRRPCTTNAKTAPYIVNIETKHNRRKRRNIARNLDSGKLTPTLTATRGLRQLLNASHQSAASPSDVSARFGGQMPRHVPGSGGGVATKDSRHSTVLGDAAARSGLSESGDRREILTQEHAVRKTESRQRCVYF